MAAIEISWKSLQPEVLVTTGEECAAIMVMGLFVCTSEIRSSNQKESTGPQPLDSILFAHPGSCKLLLEHGYGCQPESRAAGPA